MKILVVDDNYQWINFHLEALKACIETDYSVDTALSAREGYEKALNNKYDLIISDLQMELDFEPEHAGEWMISKIKKLKNHINTPILIVSASFDIAIVARKLNVDYLSKSTLVQNRLSYKLKLGEFMKL